MFANTISAFTVLTEALPEGFFKIKNLSDDATFVVVGNWDILLPVLAMIIQEESYHQTHLL
jgi:hypothetical protein